MELILWFKRLLYIGGMLSSPYLYVYYILLYLKCYVPERPLKFLEKIGFYATFFPWINRNKKKWKMKKRSLEDNKPGVVWKFDKLSDTYCFLLSALPSLTKGPIWLLEIGHYVHIPYHRKRNRSWRLYILIPLCPIVQNQSLVISNYKGG